MSVNRLLCTGCYSIYNLTIICTKGKHTHLGRDMVCRKTSLCETSTFPQYPLLPVPPDLIFSLLEERGVSAPFSDSSLSNVSRLP